MSQATTPNASAQVPVTSARIAIQQAGNVPTLVSKLQIAAQAGAQDVPEAIRAVAALDPQMSAWMQGKSAAGSATLIAPVVTHAVVWAVGHWSLGWDAATTESVAGLLSCAIMAAFRVMLNSPPITSVLPKRSA